MLHQTLESYGIRYKSSGQETKLKEKCENEAFGKTTDINLSTFDIFGFVNLEHGGGSQTSGSEKAR